VAALAVGGWRAMVAVRIRGDLDDLDRLPCRRQPLNSVDGPEPTRGHFSRTSSAMPPPLCGPKRLWEPAHGEVAVRRHWPRHYDPGTRAYLSAGLPGTEWWVAGRAVDRAEDAEVELEEVGRHYDERGIWDSAFGR
jgi:hypothetical protein